MCLSSRNPRIFLQQFLVGFFLWFLVISEIVKKPPAAPTTFARCSFLLPVYWQQIGSPSFIPGRTYIENQNVIFNDLNKSIADFSVLILFLVLIFSRLGLPILSKLWDMDERKSAHAKEEYLTQGADSMD